MKVVELPIEILIDILAEPSMDLVPTMAAMRTSFFFLEIAWCVWSLADAYPGANFSRDRYIGIWVRFQWSWVDLSRCMYLVRAPIDGHLFVIEVSFTSTTLISMWCTSVAATTTALSRLRCVVRGALTRQGRVSPMPGELTRTSPVASCFLGLSLFFSCLFLCECLVPHRLSLRSALL